MSSVTATWHGDELVIEGLDDLAPSDGFGLATDRIPLGPHPYGLGLAVDRRRRFEFEREREGGRW